MYRILERAYGKAGPKLVEEVARFNGLKDAAKIREGQELRLPVLEGYRRPR